MSTNKPWKVFERLVSKRFEGKRITPADDRTRGDVLHDFMYIECKAYVGKTTKPAIVTLHANTEGKAKIEEKIPVVCHKRIGSSDFLVTVAVGDMAKLYEALKGIKYDESRDTTSSDDSRS